MIRHTFVQTAWFASLGSPLLVFSFSPRLWRLRFAQFRLWVRYSWRRVKQSVVGKRRRRSRKQAR